MMIRCVLGSSHRAARADVSEAEECADSLPSCQGTGELPIQPCKLLLRIFPLAINAFILIKKTSGKQRKKEKRTNRNKSPSPRGTRMDGWGALWRGSALLGPSPSSTAQAKPTHGEAPSRRPHPPALLSPPAPAAQCPSAGGRAAPGAVPCRCLV